MEVHVLEGLVRYADGLDYQKRLLEARIANEVPDVYILLQHAHVFTIGRSGTREEVLLDDEELAKRGIDLHYVSRGGRVTYHGPGQLVGYPVMKLEDKDISGFIWRMEEDVIELLNRYGIAGGRDPRNRGVWVRGKKVCSIGVAFKRWVSYHGFALNVNTDLSYFRLISPCGFDPSIMTSMKEVLGKELNFNEVIEGFVDVLKARIGDVRVLTVSL